MSPPNPQPPTEGFKFRWDVLLFGLFVATAVPAATGIRLHEWLSVVLIPVLLTHLTLNWRWIVDVTRRTFSALPREVRFNQVLNTLLFIAMTTTIATGVLISRFVLPAVGIPARSDSFWHALHESSSTVLMILLGIHLAMHGRWLVARWRQLRAPASSAGRSSS
jgi:hypothetical protein